MDPPCNEVQVSEELAQQPGLLVESSLIPGHILAEFGMLRESLVVTHSVGIMPVFC